MPTGKEIRQQFIDFFSSKGHVAVKSSPVIPVDDPTLLFTNAGMNQFKNIFLGQKEPAFPRAADSQKCIRAGGKHNDLEEVGKDGYHHTFFEMLGNWSFADYYKAEAISWAWELLTEVWQLPKDKLHATVHHTDNEAGELWQKLTDIIPEQITIHGDKDNFWEMGETGPCGPCSEIHFDRGADFCDKAGTEGHICAVNGDCARYIELWNLVFIQYNRDETGALTPLPHKYVDTGAGLERICQILQHQTSNYHTDLFMPILDKIGELSGIPYMVEQHADAAKTQTTQSAGSASCSTGGVSHRVIADHIRCLSFALADGGFPSNEGRGYVLRRILRRAARHGRLLGMREPFLHKLVDAVCAVMGHHYHELVDKKAYIKTIIKAEEERFNQTLDTGLQKFAEIKAKTTDQTISGAAAFMLYDTYGFPLDLTMILAEEQGLQVDAAGFETEMQKQRQRAREASNFKLELKTLEWTDFRPATETVFVGYEQLSHQTVINRYAFGEDGTICLQLAETPFYAESGGQVADSGVIFNSHFMVTVTDVRRVNDTVIHYGRLEHGMVDEHEVNAEVDSDKRDQTSRNHTATHLLHKALRILLGEHVQQKGSLVCPEYLRFDFAHHSALSSEQIRDLERLVNAKIRENKPVLCKQMPLENARQEGAMALFGEKYGDVVRVVSVSGFSKELCGGTHVPASGCIGMVKVLSESSSAAGIRRLEAVTGDAAESFVYALQDKFLQIGAKLNAPEKKIMEKLDNVLSRQTELETELKNAASARLQKQAARLCYEAVKPSGQYKFSYLIAQAEVADNAELQLLADFIRNSVSQTAVVLFARLEDKISISVSASADLGKEFHAGQWAGKIAALVGGKGGGRPDSAMAGGKDVEKLADAIEQTRVLLG